ncbi:hypothetical protein Ddye_027233 [Dipteronia dyeriana]|uniref:NET domain-containing protein n=1 Tax=Dipteronia dyeriana TaxID=168575 RepID=A0AAD9WR71_9ROSI|nr:hypothetical protein Ddye_027233 [Dipteronia dyeriana]
MMEAKSEPSMRVPAAVSNPKPKAKDPNKREMSTEERRKLGIGLQSLPPEKIGHVVNILMKRNRNLQDKDEFQVDVEALDMETLWELDRFVTYYKKIKRQALMSHGEAPAVEKIQVAMEVKSEPLQVPATVSDPNPPISASRLPDDDTLNLDIDALDMESLWELDRFVTESHRDAVDKIEVAMEAKKLKKGDVGIEDVETE